VIRIATARDDVISIAVASGIPGLNARRAREILAAALVNDECVAHHDEQGTVNGFIVTYRRAFFGRDFVKILAVAPGGRRRGIGASLLRHACIGAVTDTIFISTNQSNEAMRQLLSHDHWTFSGRLTGVDDDDPELVFWKHRTRGHPLEG
jgi:GNAT superfamily N-acetyltransferase